MFDYPSVDDKATNEENVQALRSWAYQTVEELRSIITALQDEINEMKGEE